MAWEEAWEEEREEEMCFCSSFFCSSSFLPTLLERLADASTSSSFSDSASAFSAF